MITTAADTFRTTLAPLWHQEPRSPVGVGFPARVQMWQAGDGWRLGADWIVETGTPMDEHTRHAFSWRIPADLRGSVLAGILDDERVLAIAERIAADWDDQWDGNNMVGVLTDDAQAANEEMGTLLDVITDDEEIRVPVYAAADWIGDLDVEPDADLDALAAEQEGIIVAERVIVEGDILPELARRQASGLVGTAEIARLAGVRPATVQAWTERHDSFPDPERVLSMGRVWRWGDVRDWLAVDRPAGRPRKA
jgi:hypothetical protein